jgi:polysaccharide pyruvyl transferase WcaK-like protein
MFSSLFQKMRTRMPSGASVRPRIGITGSFGRGNYGDELYVKTYQYWLGPWADLFLQTARRGPSYFRDLGRANLRTMDAVVLGGGDLLCPYRSHISPDFINPAYLQRPVHVAGIGVERNRDEIDPDVLARWKSFLTHPSIRSISMRDPGSRKWVEEHIAPAVPVGEHPDLVCALPLPVVARPSGPPILGLVTRHIKQPSEYEQIIAICRTMMERGWRVRHIIGGVGDHGKKDLENSRHVVLPGKETMHSRELDDISRALGECSQVLSMKLHTTIVATMYGVPTISVNPVVKAKAFMRSIGRETLAIAPHRPELAAMFDKEIPPVPMDQVERLRGEASQALRALSQRIWTEFRQSSPERSALPPDVPVVRAPA